MSRKSVSEDAKAIVRRNTEEVQGKGRFDVFEELFGDDFVDHTTQPGTTPDKAGVRRLYTYMRRAFPDFHAEIHWQLADGDRVTTYKTYHGTHEGEFLGIAPTHRKIHFESVDVMRVQNGKITDHWGVGNLLATVATDRRLDTAGRRGDCPVRMAREVMRRIVVTGQVIRGSGGCSRERDVERQRILQERIARDETAILAASAGWGKAAQSKDLEKSLTFFADNAIMLSPNSPAVQGKENIAKEWQQILALPGPGLSFSAAKVEVARSGDLAWEYGTYEFATSDKTGKTTTEKGTYVTVWKKQPDGAWKVVGDIHNKNA